MKSFRLPVVNFLQHTPVGLKHLNSIDMSGQIKDMATIGKMVCDKIRESGPENVTAVCMDGACEGASETLVRFHSNLQLEKSIREWRESTFPWEGECEIEEPEGDGDFSKPEGDDDFSQPVIEIEAEP